MKKIAYRITKKFTSGHLKGIEYTEITYVRFILNKEYKACAGSNYKIIKLEVLD